MDALSQKSVGFPAPAMWLSVGQSPVHLFPHSFQSLIRSNTTMSGLCLRPHPSGRSMTAAMQDKCVFHGASEHCWFAWAGSQGREEARDQRPPSECAKPFEAPNKGLSKKVRSLRPEGVSQMRLPGLGWNTGRVVAADFSMQRTSRDHK